MSNYVQLDRQFSLVHKTQEEAENFEAYIDFGLGKSDSWDDLNQEFRCVILAEAGAGKTEELRHRARHLAAQGKFSFFIRIEDIDTEFYSSFEIGDEKQFQSWLESSQQAWFFLDSIDEARLENPSYFAKAIRLFARAIRNGAHRAHICLSSRPYAWRPSEDRILLDDILFHPAPTEVDENSVNQQSQPKSALRIYVLRPLDKERVRRFCIEREAKEVDRLLIEIERVNLWSLAGRPFDLENILTKWDADNALGSRKSLLLHNIENHLNDDHNSDRAQRSCLSLEKAKEGARRLAAAVVLSGMAGINVPDASPLKAGIDAHKVLADWDPKDVHALLERAVFNDIIYGAVRFRHREIRELLAAEWFEGLLRYGNSRHSVEALFFREQYGEKVITPRLRPVLCWLILVDNEILRQAVAIHPEIVLEGGDPSLLPLCERVKILSDVVQRIVSDEDDHSVRDNSAIARIASPDLSEEALRLLTKYGDNDDAIFFLGRLVWQGKMTPCIAPLRAIAVDSTRGKYARVASVRAILTCDDTEPQKTLWSLINKGSAQIPRELLAELIEGADFNSDIVSLLLKSLKRLPPYERYKGTGLSRTLHLFLGRADMKVSHNAAISLLEGLQSYFDGPPYIDNAHCQISETYAWLHGFATNVVQKLIQSRDAASLDKSVINILIMSPRFRFWRDDHLRRFEDSLHILVPDWPDLNDALYWASIEHVRATSSKPIRDDWLASTNRPFWSFTISSLPRLLGYMRSRINPDDRVIALNRAFTLYVREDKPADILAQLTAAVADDEELRGLLYTFLNPLFSPEQQKHQDAEAELQREQDATEASEKQHRDQWIASLRSNPEKILYLPNQEDFTDDHFWLLREIQERSVKTNRTWGACWKALIPDFGEAVANAYREAAIKHWRLYKPTLESEGVRRDNSTPYSLIFAMAGIEIEATETVGFPDYLGEEEVKQALRYITWELNGFPRWLESVNRAFPALVKDAVMKEILWELDFEAPEGSISYILNDINYGAPWLHSTVAPEILEWVKANPTRINLKRGHLLRILVNGNTSTGTLADLASNQIAISDDQDIKAWWCAIRVGCDPENGINEVKQWLKSVDYGAASHSAQIFITVLLGGQYMDEEGFATRLRTAEHLKMLYILMHRYIRADNDIDRSNGAVFSPGLRDDAQNARDRLFNMLSEIPGKPCYTALKELAHEHPDPVYRMRMAKLAYKHAEADSDLELWKAEQVNEFNRSQTIIPSTHRQLFELAVNRLYDLKNWLERGNDSAWETWQRADQETEMRNLVTGWLNQKYGGQYTTSQESELANGQRTDIWLHNPQVVSPVPIELKLLDKKWSGPDLCERLQNQLVGDYLRETTAGCGVMLLISQKKGVNKRWIIGGKKVGLSELAGAMKIYWQSIACNYPSIEKVELVVIDLTLRGLVSDS